MNGAEWATQLNFLNEPLIISLIGASSKKVKKSGMSIIGSTMLAESYAWGNQQDGEKILINLANVLFICEDTSEAKA